MGKTSEVYGQAPPEVRIAYEVAMYLRILPRFSDDGVPEGTVERTPEVEAEPAPEAEPLQIEPTSVGRVGGRVDFLDPNAFEDEDESELFLEDLV